MGTLGSYLREARESLGVDLRQAAQETRISLTFLKAMEEEDFPKLPGEVFVKGFLKSYARYLGLPEDEVMRRYADRAAASPAAQAGGRAALARPSRAVPAAAAPARPQEPASARSASGASFERYLLAGGIAIAVAALLLVVLPGRHADNKHDAPAPAPAEPALQTVTSSTTTTVPEKLYLDIVALDDLWVLVRIDASPQKKAVLKKGETVTWTADARFILSYGGAGAARILLNGKELTVTGAKDDVVRDLTINAGGIVGPKLVTEQPKPRKPRSAKPQAAVSRRAAEAPVPQPPPPAQPAVRSEPAAQPVPAVPAVPAPPVPPPAASKPAPERESGFLKPATAE